MAQGVHRISPLPHPVSFLRRIRQPLNHITPPGHTHDGHARHLPDPPFQIAIVGRHDVDLVLHDAIDDAVVRVHALVVALQPLPPLVPRDAERDAVFAAQPLQLRHHAARQCRDAFRVQRVHHGWEEVKFVLDCVFVFGWALVSLEVAWGFFWWFFWWFFGGFEHAEERGGGVLTAEKIGVDEDGVRWDEGCIVLEEERGGDLRSVDYGF